jgi:aquaporin TIP
LEAPVLAEFVATAVFVFLGAGTVVVTGTLSGGELTPARLVAIALSFGLAISLLFAATARISGGHINPAVTVAALVARKIYLLPALSYIVAQFAGATAGSLLVMLVVPGDGGSLGGTVLAPAVGAGSGLLLETILTFILVFVIFATAFNPRSSSAIAPVAIGITLVADHLLGVPLTGASMNPARSFGPALVAGQWADHWVYWVGPFLGGILAAVVCQRIYLPKEG